MMITAGVLTVAGFVAAAILSGGVTLVLLPELVAAAVPFAAAVGVVGLLGIASGTSLLPMHQSFYSAFSSKWWSQAR